jgi:hypothetical protein
MLDYSGRKQQTRVDVSRRKFSSFEIMHQLITNLPEPRGIFRRTLTECFASNPDSFRLVAALMALYLHVGPFSREVIAHIEKLRAALEPPAIEASVERASAT